MTNELFDAPEMMNGSSGTVGGTAGTAWDAAGVGRSTTDTAKEQVQGVAHEGVQGGKHVASVATDQAKEVVSEAGQQAKALLGQAKSELMVHAASQQTRIGEQLQLLSQELGSMAASSAQEGLGADLAAQASERVGALGRWLSQREPGSLVGELKDFARNKPGTFLAVAAGMGLVAGRVTRGVKAGPPVEAAEPARPTPFSPPQVVAPAWAPPASPAAGQLAEPFPARSSQLTP